jgi:hypothetical protein
MRPTLLSRVFLTDFAASAASPAASVTLQSELEQSKLTTGLRWISSEYHRTKF